MRPPRGLQELAGCFAGPGPNDLTAPLRLANLRENQPNGNAPPPCPQITSGFTSRARRRIVRGKFCRLLVATGQCTNGDARDRRRCIYGRQSPNSERV